MIVIRNDQTVYVDVDETLILWDCDPSHPDAFWIGGQCVRSHKKHIDQVKKHKARGHQIVIWTQGGYDWAEQAVKLLKLEDYVDLVIRKPMWFYDDITASEFMPEINRIYYDPDKEYKAGEWVSCEPKKD